MRLDREARAKTSEIDEQNALVRHIHSTVEELRSVVREAEQERVQLLGRVKGMKAELKDVQKEKQTVEWELEECIHSIKKTQQERIEYESKEEEQTKEWEKTMQRKAKLRFREFRQREELARKERMRQFEKEDSDFDSNLALLEKRLQEKRGSSTISESCSEASEKTYSGLKRSESRLSEGKLCEQDVQTKKSDKYTSTSESEVDGKGKGVGKKSSPRKKQMKGRKKREVQMKQSDCTSMSESEKVSRPTSARMRPQKYDGKGVLADFLSQFEACREYNRWSDKEAAFQLFSCCQDDALNRLTTDDVTPRTCTYVDLVEVLEREFGPRECKSSYIMELNQVKQKPGESARELGNRIKKLASLAFRGKDTNSKATREEMSLNSFTLALHNKDIRDVVFGAESASLKQAIDKAEFLESYHKRDEEIEHAPVRRREKHVSFVRKSGVEQVDEKLSETECEELEERIVQKVLSDIKVCTPIESARDVYEIPAVASRSTGSYVRPSQFHVNEIRIPQTGSVTCYHCGEPGHVRPNCPFRSGGGNENRKPQTGQVLCYQCGEPGHVRPNCPYKSGKDSRPKVLCMNCNSPGHGWRECGYPPLCFVSHEEGHRSRNCPKSGNEGRLNHWPKGRPQTMREGQRQPINQYQAPLTQ
ncbi:uncharacterized protein [Amphiura filiformis]|uniref:uncharacterized protein n=1 Tax=Amphiura filiformis TaxID=82378 RepID=UPI003B2243C5